MKGGARLRRKWGALSTGSGAAFRRKWGGVWRVSSGQSPHCENLLSQASNRGYGTAAPKFKALGSPTIDRRAPGEGIASPIFGGKPQRDLLGTLQLSRSSGDRNRSTDGFGLIRDEWGTRVSSALYRSELICRRCPSAIGSRTRIRVGGLPPALFHFLHPVMHMVPVADGDLWLADFL